MRKIQLLVTLPVLAFVLAGYQPVSAQTSNVDIKKIILVNKPVQAEKKEKPVQPKIKHDPIIIVHAVGPKESLSSIAADYRTTVDRIWAKNTDISDPNIISVDDKVIIPLPTEALKERPLPVLALVDTPIHPSVPVTESEGNTYTPGYCTWYVKNLRPDLPNSLGNASSWYSRAAALGYSVGSIPKVGAVAWYGDGEGHVAVVTGVGGEYVTITEMNHIGPFISNVRTVPISTFQYIY